MKERHYWMEIEAFQSEESGSEKNGQSKKVDRDEGFLKTSRRDFLKAFGFGIGSIAVIACQKTPVKYALPYVNKPPELTPGEALWYASTYFDGQDYASILVKTREGRPIKIEGNRLSSITEGGVTARVHASVLSLYDKARLRAPVKKGNKITWQLLDAEVTSAFKKAVAAGKQIVFLTRTIISPSTLSLIEKYKAQFGNDRVRHVQFDSVSYSGLLEAYEEVLGSSLIPRYHFDRADVVVSFGADFLGTWLSPAEFIRDYAKRRKLHEGQKTMLRHYQFEGHFSVTGANADYRGRIKPSLLPSAVLYVYNKVASALGQPTLAQKGDDISSIQPLLDKAVRDLLSAQGKSIVLCGLNDKNVQLLVAKLNFLLGNYGTTLDLRRPCFLRRGIDREFTQLLSDMENGQVGALVVYDVNPAYTHGEAFVSRLKKVPFKVAVADRIDETAQHCDYVAALSHYLESWGDAEPYLGYYSLQQPAIQTLFDTRQFEQCLLAWLGENTDYYSYLKTYWKEKIYPKSGSKDNPELFWNKALHDGVLELSDEQIGKLFEGKPDLDFSKVDFSALTISKGTEGLELFLYEKVSIGDGRNANNPWLQELPDPITRATWDNYLIISPKLAKEKKLKEGDVVKVTLNGKVTIDEVPVVVLPGQENHTASLALGYGRTRSAGDKKENVAGNRGVNSYPLVQLVDGRRVYHGGAIQIEPTGKTYPIAKIQLQMTAVGRTSVIRETTLPVYLNAKSSEEYNPREEVLKFNEENDLYPPHPMNGIRWAMTIDLNSCVGCGACVVSCIAENNIPVVGKDEIRRGRDMHWIRIDRYFSSDPGDPKEAAEDPEVVFQPMLCQQCGHAPCENVCPVLATTHSSEGLNQQAYNRCFGTRYCANNCPYKVRRFNWFDYTNPENWPYNPVDDLGRMVLNPDVTVRARGVMEKCTFCVQRLQEAKLKAKMEGRPLQDGEAQTACQQSCPADAIIFGNINDPNSKVAKYFNNPRAYRVIEELKTYPSISYLLKVRNQEENKDEQKV